MQYNTWFSKAKRTKDKQRNPTYHAFEEFEDKNEFQRRLHFR